MKPVKETTVKDEEKVLYSTVLELNDYYGNMKLPINTPNDIRKISDKQTWFNKFIESFWAKAKSVKLPEKEDKEEYTEEEKEKIYQEEANKLLSKSCGLKKEELQFLTMDKFLIAIKDMTLNNKQVAFVADWFIIEEKEKEEDKPKEEKDV